MNLFSIGGVGLPFRWKVVYPYSIPGMPIDGFVALQGAGTELIDLVNGTG